VCVCRKVLLEPPVDSFYFNGKGFVTLPQENFLRQGKDTRLTIKFRTYAENGLLVLMYKDRDFLSIELHDGKVLFQFNLGSGPGRAETKEKYNDGKVYTIQANRFKQQGLLRIEESSESELRFC
jgi:laminin alpha 3/5